MTRVVTAYAIELDGPVAIETGRDAVIVAVAIEHGRPCLWVEATPAKELHRHNFEVVRTGKPFEPADGERWVAVGSLLAPGGMRVVYEVVSL